MNLFKRSNPSFLTKTFFFLLFSNLLFSSLSGKNDSPHTNFLAPTITQVPTDETVECDGAGNVFELNNWLSTNGGGMATAMPGCEPVLWRYELSRTSMACPDSLYYEFFVNDSCGMEISAGVAHFVIEDTTSPTVTTSPFSQTVECDGNGNITELSNWLNNNAGATATDQCDPILTWAAIVIGTTAGCGGTESYTYSFSVQDQCGNVTDTGTAVFSIVDTTPPIVMTLPSDLYLECDGTAVICSSGSKSSNFQPKGAASNLIDIQNWINNNNGGGVAIDNCGNVSWTSVFNPSINKCGCSGDFIYEYFVTDDCGNQISAGTATVFIEDTTPPNIFQPALDTIVDCDGTGNIADLNFWLSINAQAAATDVCGSLTWSNYLDSFTANCTGTGVSTYGFVATDECGNADTTFADFTIIDTIPPVINIFPQSDTVECDGVGNTAALNAWLTANSNPANASDVCSGVIANYTVTATPSNCSGTGETIVDFTFTDSCGNSSSATATFLIEDTTPPTPICTDIAIDLDDNVGMHDLTQTEIDMITGGTSDACGDFTVFISQDTFSCADIGPNVVNVNYTDECGNTSSCQATIFVQIGNNLPQANCQDVTVIIDANGNASVDPMNVNNGSTGCGNLTFTLSQIEFNCDQVGPNTVTLTVSSDIAGPPSTCTAVVDVIASAACPLPPVSNMGGPTISEPCTCRGDGLFDEEVIVTSNAPGQLWTITSVTGFSGTPGNPFSAGDLMTDNGNGTYSLVGVHADGVGFSVAVTSIYWPGIQLSVSNTCFYPDLEIENDFSMVCLFSDPIPLAANVNGAAGSGGFTINGQAATIFDPMVWGVGTHTVEYTFDAGDALDFSIINGVIVGPPTGASTLAEAEADPGCIEVETAHVIVIETPDVLACNDGIQVSLDENCNAFVTVDMILEGTYGCYDDYEIVLTGPSGQTIPNPMSANQIGQNITATINHLVSGNSCWGMISVEDKLGSEIACSVELLDKFGNVIQSGDTISITCEMDPAAIPAPTSIDNCGSGQVVFVGESTVGDACGVLTLSRIYRSQDQFGNQSLNECEIVIEIRQPDLEFPDDVTWTCEQYAVFSNVIEPTELHPLILANAAAMDEDDVPGIAPYDVTTFSPWWTDGEDLDVMLDPNYDDFLQNPISDRNAACDNIAAETDQDECLANFSYALGTAIFEDCVLDPTAHSPQIIQVPVYVPEFTGNNPYPSTHPVRGLEDRDVLELTGSGVPNVMGLDEQNCKYSVVYKDQKLVACSDVDTTVTFKILRTWTVLNWCTGMTSTDIQTIKVIDKKAPEITLPDNFETEVVANQYSGSVNHVECRSSDVIGLPILSDNCSGVDSSTFRFFTPKGEGDPQYDADGNLIGFMIAAPYLSPGVHDVYFSVKDKCGNLAKLDFEIRVIDGIPPTPICREFTRVSLAGNPGGATAVQAYKFNEGSYDNCAPVYFLVRKLNNSQNCPGLTEHNRFLPEINFCCENIGDTVDVVLKVYDVDPGLSQSLNGLSQNSNECSIRVMVDDKIRPHCVAPDDVWTFCTEVPDNTDFTDTNALNLLFGEATASDNCGADVSERNPTIDIDLCGVGTITRNWTATDIYGNRSLGVCRQTIMINQKTDYEIFVPGDYEEECDDAAPADLTYEENACDLLAVNLEEQHFAASPDGSCRKLIRTWRVINWCEYDGFSAPIRLPRRDLNNDGTPGDGEDGSRNTVTGTNFNADHAYRSNGNVMVLNNGTETVVSIGFYEYKQHVKIFDNTAPDVSYAGDDTFCGGLLDQDPCEGKVSIMVQASDICTNDVTITWELDLFSSDFQTADFVGNDSITDSYPLGDHVAKFYVTDECGNVNQLIIPFEIIDCKAPTPVCFNGLSVNLMSTGTVTLAGTDFDASSFDYCNPYVVAVNKVTDINFDGFITPDEYLILPPIETTVQFDCGDVGNSPLVQMWVGEISTDNVNNWDYCVTYVEVTDNFDFCLTTGSKVNLGGKIADETGQSVEDVRVELNNGMSAMTGLDGLFDFEIAPGADITISPMKNDDIINGVSTFDLLKISQHVLNVEKLDSPYKIIAADANNSGSVTTLDLLAIRKVILRMETEFPNNTSWRFIDKDYIFQNQANPAGENFPEVINRNNLNQSDLTADFVALKVGDVTGDAVPSSAQSVADRAFVETMYLNFEEQTVKAGEEFEIYLSADQNVEGLQFTLSANDNLEFISVENGIFGKENFNLLDNDLVVSWNGNDEINNQKLFKINCFAKADLTISDALYVTNEVAKSEAYRADQFLKIGLRSAKSATTKADFELFQNVPNPFEIETTISFNLPESTPATLVITDVTGKVWRVIYGEYKKGFNEVRLKNVSEFPSGILFYTLETPLNSKTLKMSFIN